MEDFYSWMEGPLSWAAFDSETSTTGVHKNGTVSTYGKLLGSVRIGQLRAESRSCADQVPSALRDGTDWTCYDQDNAAMTNYNVRFEDTSPFGNFTLQPLAGFPARQMGKFPYDGIVVTTGRAPKKTVEEYRKPMLSTFTTRDWNVYPAPAFAVIMPPTLTADDARSVIHSLRSSHYITLATRAVFIDFSVYNPMLDRICWTRVTGEVTRSGGLMVTHEMETVRFWEDVTNADNWYWVVLVICGVYYVYFFLVEIVEWHEKGWKYWTEWLNVSQMMNIAFFVAQVTARFEVLRVVPDHMVPMSDDFYELLPAVRTRKAGIAVMAVNVFLNWFKLIAYLSLNPTFAMMSNTLSRAAGGCCGFLGIFCIILYGFAQAHAMVFQGRVYAFRTVGQTTFALLRSLLGDFDFAQLQESHAYMGPFFFICFVAIAVFIVLNMFIAIISNAYNDSFKMFKDAPRVNLVRELLMFVSDELGSMPVMGRCFRGLGRGSKGVVNAVRRTTGTSGSVQSAPAKARLTPVTPGVAAVPSASAAELPALAAQLESVTAQMAVLQRSISAAIAAGDAGAGGVQTAEPPGTPSACISI